MRSFSSLSANSPINSVWILTDDNEGEVNCRVGISLTPNIAISSGILKPRSWIAFETPKAIESLPQNIAVGVLPSLLSISSFASS